MAYERDTDGNTLCPVDRRPRQLATTGRAGIHGVNDSPGAEEGRHIERNDRL
jgi:hypothetical protein